MNMKNERETLRAMVRLFCRQHNHGETLCASCAELLAYAEQRLSKCRFGQDKPSCRKCPVHCYAPEMRKRITEVMRYAGPRMPVYHPAMSLRHLLNRRQPGKPPVRGR
jgi:hypothetical protein